MNLWVCHDVKSGIRFYDGFYKTNWSSKRYLEGQCVSLAYITDPNCRAEIFRICSGAFQTSLVASPLVEFGWLPLLVHLVAPGGHVY